MWRTAISGFGSAAEYFHLPSLAQTTQFRVLAAFDPIAERRHAAERLGVPHTHDLRDIGRALRELEVQVLVVASPNSEHLAHAQLGLDAGITVVVDKPVVENGEEYAALDAAARRAGCLLVPFHNRLYDVDQQEVYSAVASGLIGRVIRVDLTAAQPGPWQAYAATEFEPTWRSQRKWGGGVLNDWGPHLLHQCLRLLPAPMELTTAFSHHPEGEEVETMISLSIRAACASARILVSACEPEATEKLRVVGTSGCITVWGTDSEGTIAINTRHRHCRASYCNRPESGSAIYQAINSALSGASRQHIDTLSSEALLVYSLLGRARRLIEAA